MSSKLLGVISTLVTLTVLSQSPASATVFRFGQGGFTDGSTVSGSFTGSDNDNNNQINLEELTDFNLLWTGRTEPFPISFEHDLENLVDFSYDILSNALFLRSEQNIIDATELVELSPSRGYVSFSWFAGGGEAFSRSRLVVQAVPEPLTILGTGAALGLGALFKGKAG